MEFITKMETANTGGHCMVDILHLSNGLILAMNDECIAFYRSVDDFWDDDGDKALKVMDLDKLKGNK